MKRSITAMICVMVLFFCMTGAQADDNSIFQHAMTISSADIEMKDTIALSEALSFSIPADWVKMDEEDTELEGVGYTGVDTDGNSVMLFSMKGDTSYGSLQLAQKRLEKMGTVYTATTFHGIDMLIVQGDMSGDEKMEVLFCVKKDGTPLIIGIQTIVGDAMQSDKLLSDIASIMNSLQAVDDMKLLSFGDTLPGDAMLEAELRQKETNGSTIIPSGEGNIGMISALPDELLREGYTSIADAGRAGRDVFWAVKTDGTLHIAGTGEMDRFWYDQSYFEKKQPWAKYCDRITGAVIHEGITNVIENTFSSCPNMKTIEISSTVIDISDTTIWSSGVEAINVDPWNPVYASVDGVLYSKDGSVLICYPPRKVFDGYDFPLFVTKIGSFAGNTLRSIRIPEQIKEIAVGAFAHCDSLQEVVLPANMKKIGDGLFEGIPALSTVTIPESVTCIGRRAFCDNQEVIQIYYQGNKSQWNQIEIEEQNYSLMSATIHFSDGTLFSAVQDNEFFWNTTSKKAPGRIGRITRENTRTVELGGSFHMKVPADWSEKGNGTFVGKDEYGSIARLQIITETNKDYKGSETIGLSDETVIKETINGVDVNLVTAFTPFREHVSMACWDSEHIYTIRVKFENNLPMQGEKLVDDTAFIFGSLCKIGQEARGEVVISKDEQGKQCEKNLKEFYFAWSSKSWNNALELCSMRWKKKQTGDLKESLAALVPNGDPLMCVLDAVEIPDSSAVVDTTILIDHNDGNEPVNYHFDILMESENGEWLVNPESLTDYQEIQEAVETYDEMTEIPVPDATPALPETDDQDEVEIEKCRRIIEKFMACWYSNSIGDMLEFCSIAWKTGQTTNLKTKMFALVANRTPLEYILHNIRIQGDNAYAYLTVKTDRNNGKDPVNYSMTLHLVREAGEWYVDPESIINYELVE